MSCFPEQPMPAHKNDDEQRLRAVAVSINMNAIGSRQSTTTEAVPTQSKLTMSCHNSEGEHRRREDPQHQMTSEQEFFSSGIFAPVARWLGVIAILTATHSARVVIACRSSSSELLVGCMQPPPSPGSRPKCRTPAAVDGWVTATSRQGWSEPGIVALCRDFVPLSPRHTGLGPQ